MSKIKEFAVPTFVLTLICLISAFLLGMTNEITAPKIAEISAENEKKARQIVFESAASFGETTEKDGISLTPALDENGATIGYVVVTVEKGYGGAIEVMTGVDTDGKVTGVDILSHSETAGLGANADKVTFRDLFKGKTAGVTVSKDAPGENSIDALTGATITSRAVTKAVNAAIQAAGGENIG